MITKEQLHGMQNYEISLVLCDLLGYKVEFIHAAHESEFPTINVFGKTVGEWFAVEFGRWDCIMPLAVEHKLCLISPHSHTKTWSARQTDGGGLWSVSDFTYSDTNPLRAIACCLILVLQGKK